MIEDGRAQQRELYGEPLSDIAERIMAGLHLSQARLADALGLSAPMLSQLIGGHRVKIGNPLVLQRLQALNELAASGVAPSDVDARIAEIKDAAPDFTGTRTAESDRHAAVEALRAAASRDDLGRLASLAESDGLSSRLVDLLREASA